MAKPALSLFNHAEDESEITATGLSVTIPFATYNNCISTKNYTALEPGVIENKFYAPGVGLIKKINVNDNEELRLIAIQ